MLLVGFADYNGHLDINISIENIFRQLHFAAKF